MILKSTAHKETIDAMVRAIDEQIAGKPMPKGSTRILEGYTEEELRTIRLFVRSFEGYTLEGDLR